MPALFYDRQIFPIFLPIVKLPRPCTDTILQHQKRPMHDKTFVAINYITCSEDYTERFETLFGSRAHAIDTMPGFRHMHVLRPQAEGQPYLVVSYWDSEAQFKAWTGSPQFLEGHKRAFADLAEAKKEGRTPPMKSEFQTYQVISN